MITTHPGHERAYGDLHVAPVDRRGWGGGHADGRLVALGRRLVSDRGLVAVSEGPLWRWRSLPGAEVFIVVDAEAIVRDQTTGLFGFRLELGRDRNGTRMQAPRRLRY